MTAKQTSKRGKRSKGSKPAVKKPGVRRFAEPPRLRFETLIAALVMVLTIVVLYPGHIFEDKIFFASDNKAAASFAAAAERAMEEEDVYPVWNPYLFAGMPSFVSLSYTPYVYPPSAVIGLLTKYLFFPKYTWLFLHTFLVGFGTYLLLRDRRVLFFPALTAGVAMMWMPNLVAYGAYGHGSQACAVGYIPLALLFWDRLWRGKGVLVNASALIIVLGFSMLRGHLQISYYTYGLVGVHLLFFGGWRIVDGARGRVPEYSALPKRFYGKLTTDGKRYGAPAAVTEFLYLTTILAVAVGASFLMSAVLYIPAHDYVQYSIRGASESGGLDYGYATSWSLHPSEMLTFIWPFSFGFGKDLYIGYMPFTDYPNYVGFVVLAGAIAAVVMARSRFVWFLISVVAFSTLISFGRFFPIVYDPLFKFLPFFDKFRVPVMVLIVQQFALVLMFAIGFEALLRADPERGKRNAVTGLAVAFLIFMVVFLSQGFWQGGFAESISGRVRGVSSREEQLMVARVVGSYLFQDLVRFAIVQAIFFAGLFLYYTRKIPYLAVCGAILILSMVDLYLVDRHILHPEKFRKHELLKVIHDRDVVEEYKQSDGMIEALLRDQRPFRVFPMDSPQRPFSTLYASNRFMVFGISSIGGYHPAKLAIYQEFFQGLQRGLAAGNFQVLDMLNVRYLVTRTELPAHRRFRPVWKGANYEGEPRFVYENVEALPRAWLVDSYRTAGEKEALDLVVSGQVDLAREAILMKAPETVPAPTDEADSSFAEVVKLGFNEIKVRTHSQTPAILILSEVYYPDWKARVDGQVAEVLRTDFILRGVALESGEHEVVFHYDASLIKNSAYASASTLGIVTLALIAGLVARSRGRKSGSTGRSSNV